MPISKERLAEIDAIPDEGIDTSDIPEMDEKFFATAKLVMPPGASKKAVSMRVDEDVLDWVQGPGQGAFEPDERRPARLHAFPSGRLTRHGGSLRGTSPPDPP